MVGALSPVAALRRRAARAAIVAHERALVYAAAKSGGASAGWSLADGSVNTVIASSSVQVRARVRQLVRDMPYFARAVGVLTDYTVGEGIHFQSRVKGADGKLDKTRILRIENEFKFWMDEADIAKKLHYYEMMQLAKRQDAECGEFAIVKVLPKRMRGRRVPFALQIIEPDWFSSLTNTGQAPVYSPANQTVIDQGVEYDYLSGEVLAYHLLDPWGFGRPIRIAAADVIHKFKTLRPGQLRGISPFTPGVLMARDLDELMTAELDGTKLAAKYMAIVETPDPIGRQAGIGVTTDASTGKKIEELENSIIEYLRPGEKMQFAKSDRPSENFSPFVRLVLTMFSVVTGAPYELISGDYQGLNFSTARINRNDFANFLKPESTRHIRHFAMPTLVPWMQAAVASGALDLPGFFVEPYLHLACQWQPPGMEPVDPLREVKSNLDELAAALRSPQEIAAARGRDLEEIYDEIADARAMAAEKGIEIRLDKTSTAQANNPAAVDDQKSAPALGDLVRGIIENEQLLQEGHA
jgi:lambda family phage portal protein